MNKTILNNWNGGENRGPEESVALNELSRMYGFTHTDGVLRSSNGQTAYTFDAGNSGGTPVQMYRYAAPNGNRYTLVVDSNSKVYVDLELTEPAVQHRPIYNPADTSTDAAYSFCPFGGQLFFSRYDHATSETTFPSMQYWDGFQYSTGTVTCAAGTTVTGVGTSNFPGVRCGDTIFIGADAACTTWNGPYYVTDINQIVTLTDADGTDKFTLTYGGETSGEIAYDATAATVKTALEAMTAFAVGDVTVTGSAGGPWTIRLVGTYFQSDSLTAFTATGTGCTATVTFSLTINTNGPTATSVPYIISRVHQAGLRPPTAVTLAAASGGGTSPGFTTDTGYHFAACWANLATGRRSNPTYCAATVDVTNGQKVTVTIPDTGTLTGSATQEDALEIWRETTAESGVYYLAKTVKRDQAGYLLPSTTDISGDEVMGTTALTANRDEPPRGGKLLAWNGYMFMWGVEQANTAGNTWTSGKFKNRLYWSAFNQPEYWDDGLEYGVITPANLADPFTGGMVQFHDQANPIMDVAVEGGSADNIRSNLLIMTKFGPFHRFSGYNHDTWVIDTGVIDSTCTTMRALVSNNDLLGWWSAQGPVAKANTFGSNEVLRIYRKQFPTESRPFRDVYTGARVKHVCGANWGDWFVWAYPSTEGTVQTYPTRLIMYHIPTGSWTSLCENDFGDGDTDQGDQYWYIRDLCAWPAGTAGSTNEEDRLYAIGSIAKANTGAIGYAVRLETKTSTATYWDAGSTDGVNCLARTGFITLDDPYEKEKVQYLEFCFNKPVSQQTVSIAVWDAETGAAITKANNSFTLASGTVGRHIKKVHLGNSRARSFQIEVSGSFTAQVSLNWIRLVTAKGGTVS